MASLDILAHLLQRVCVGDLVKASAKAAQWDVLSETKKVWAVKVRQPFLVTQRVACEQVR
jgi:hypothetical protein